MENETHEPVSAESAPATAEVAPKAEAQFLQPTHVYALAGLCLVVGLAIGYLLRESPWSSAPQPAATSGMVQGSTPMSMPGTMNGAMDGAANAGVPGMPNSPHGNMGGGHVHTLDDMKKMADKQAAPLLEKLKSNPTNTNLLIQIGAIYHETHQFKEASSYYDRAVQVDPKNIAVRNKLAASLYRNGDSDGAISQLNSALIISPQDASTLFNIGVIKWQGKHDGKGALAAWQQLLKTNPELPADKKATVQKFIAEVETAQSNAKGSTRSTQQ
jgi:Flp pilus assembly protein TadD